MMFVQLVWYPPPPLHCRFDLLPVWLCGSVTVIGTRMGPSLACKGCVQVLYCVLCDPPPLHPPGVQCSCGVAQLAMSCVCVTGRLQRRLQRQSDLQLCDCGHRGVCTTPCCASGRLAWCGGYPGSVRWRARQCVGVVLSDSERQRYYQRIACCYSHQVCHQWREWYHCLHPDKKQKQQ